jgi:hypothetical protein
MNYYFLLFSQKNIFNNQVLEEILRERSNSYFLRNKISDFWILISPKFLSNFKQSLDNSSFLFTNQKTFYGVIISPNKDFIEWLKLRLGYFIDIENTKEEFADITKITIDGGFANIETTKLTARNFLSENCLVEPRLLSENYKRIITTYSN